MPWGKLGWGNTLLNVEISGGGSGDGNPPVVTFDPPQGQPIGRYAPIRVYITDETGVVGLTVEAFYDSLDFAEVIYANNKFERGFDLESYIQGATTSLLMYLKRDGGWIETPRIRVIAYDAGGNITD